MPLLYQWVHLAQQAGWYAATGLKAGQNPAWLSSPAACIAVQELTSKEQASSTTPAWLYWILQQLSVFFSNEFLSSSSDGYQEPW